MSDRKESFKRELQELLRKYHAELSVEETRPDQYGGYGPGDFKMFATFETVMSDDGAEILETYEELELGDYLCGD